MLYIPAAAVHVQCCDWLVKLRVKHIFHSFSLIRQSPLAVYTFIGWTALANGGCCFLL